MKKKEKTAEQKREELFEKFKSIELSPLPYFSHELLSLPDDLAKELRQIADRHNCTVSYVISHFFADFFSETKDISEISQESLIQISKDKPYLFIKKMENHLPEFRSLVKRQNGQKIINSMRMNLNNLFSIMIKYLIYGDDVKNVMPKTIS